MNSKTLRAWQAQLNLTPAQAADLLGVAHATYFRWLAETTRIPKTAGLACNAIAHNLGEWSKGE